MSYPLPHASVPVVDPKTGLMTEPWLLYFAKEQQIGAAVDPVNSSNVSASAKAAGAETVALQALGRPSQRPIPPDSIMPAIPPLRRQWP